jgi:hypothetical protein
MTLSVGLICRMSLCNGNHIHCNDTPSFYVIHPTPQQLFQPHSFSEKWRISNMHLPPSAAIRPPSPPPTPTSLVHFAQAQNIFLSLYFIWGTSLCDRTSNFFVAPHHISPWQPCPQPQANFQILAFGKPCDFPTSPQKNATPRKNEQIEKKKKQRDK